MPQNQDILLKSRNSQIEKQRWENKWDINCLIEYSLFYVTNYLGGSAVFLVQGEGQE